jgi:hypothetical protein
MYSFTSEPVAALESAITTKDNIYRLLELKQTPNNRLESKVQLGQRFASVESSMLFRNQAPRYFFLNSQVPGLSGHRGISGRIT